MEIEPIKKKKQNRGNPHPHQPCPKKVLDERDYKNLATLAAQRLPMHHIAALLKLEERTFFRIMERDPKAREVYRFGRAGGVSKITNSVYDAVTSGNYPKLAMEWLKLHEKEWQAPKQNVIIEQFIDGGQTRQTISVDAEMLKTLPTETLIALKKKMAESSSDETSNQ